MPAAMKQDAFRRHEGGANGSEKWETGSAQQGAEGLGNMGKGDGIRIGKFEERRGW